MNKAAAAAESFYAVLKLIILFIKLSLLSSLLHIADVYSRPKPFMTKMEKTYTTIATENNDRWGEYVNTTNLPF